MSRFRRKLVALCVCAGLTVGSVLVGSTVTSAAVGASHISGYEAQTETLTPYTPSANWAERIRGALAAFHRYISSGEIPD
jgi:hypothetical protein